VPQRLVTIGWQGLHRCCVQLQQRWCGRRREYRRSDGRFHGNDDPQLQNQRRHGNVDRNRHCLRANSRLPLLAHADRFYGVKKSAADIGVLVEYLYDGRKAGSPPTAADNDLFLGARLALNDTSDSSVLAGFSVDLDTQELFVNIEAERRFGHSLGVELQLRTFLNAGAGDVLFALKQDDYLQIQFSWHF
jgi:hypothetical protein